MKKFVVNVVTKTITPTIVEAANAWEAIEKAEEASEVLFTFEESVRSTDPLEWEVEDFESLYSDQYLSELL